MSCNLRELDVHLGLSFPAGETVGKWGHCQCTTVLAGGKSDVVKMKLLFLSFQCGLMWSFSVSVAQGGTLASPLGFGIFTVESFLWIAASQSSCKGD